MLKNKEDLMPMNGNGYSVVLAIIRREFVEKQFFWLFI